MELEKTTAKEGVMGFMKYHWRGLISFLVPILALPVMLVDFEPKFRCAWLIVVMAVYWICELLPLYATSLLPVFMLPLLGVLNTEDVCKSYLKDPLFTFLFSLIVAMAIEYCNLHTRIALGTINLVGIKPRRLLAGLFFVTYFISLWLTNSACTAMMCPVIKAVLEELGAQGLFNLYMPEDPKQKKGGEEEEEDEEKNPSYIALGYYFAAAYASTIGGCGTLIGTGTNLTLKGLYEERFPNATEKMDFTPFIFYNFPYSLVLSILTCLYLQIFYLGLFRKNKISEEIAQASEGTEQIRDTMRARYQELGPMTCHETQVLIIFILMILLLFTQKPGFAPGWGVFFKKNYIKSSVSPVICVILLFTLPIHYRFLRFCCARPPYTENATPSLLNWKYTNDNIPWGLVFLLGGGYALSDGSIKSGMAKWMGIQMKDLGALHPILIMTIMICLGVTLTNFSSNVAICNIVIPIVCELSVTLKIHPLLLVFPAGMATNMAFHLPVGTPPNAIIAGYANIKSKFMAVAGIGPTIISILCLIFAGSVWTKLVYSNTDTFPSWAE